MVKIGSKIRKLIRESKARKDKIDNILVSTLEVLDTTNKSMEQMGKTFETMEVGIDELRNEIDMIVVNLTEFKLSIKNNFWLRLFGVK